ncbi:AT-hook motif nuclear-localized protein 10-like [Bidens hawaiensis]|uniref:AT-hook motif nuclear-localized protein 10-like n=1 Tax=Bidens hawaiensis TaxID=980011 RepID=UPI0040492187
MVAEHNTQHANVSDQQQLFEFGSDHSGDGSEGVGAGRISGETEKKKRGRPKRYSLLHGQNVDGNSDAGDDGSGGSDLESGKRERGRPASSLKKQMEALGPPGVGFTPHVIIIEQGEDLVSKLVSFSKEGARTVCILTATGVISSVTLQQSPVFGGATTYEGLFEILSLSGSFVPSESDGTINTTGLSVSLACAEGRVVGGAVAGMLVAASPIQVIVGSFIADGKKPKPKASSNSSESGRSLIDMPSPRCK